MNKWIVEYDNDVGPEDEGFREWWTVVNSENEDRRFRCNTQEDAEYLCNILNKEVGRKKERKTNE